MGYLARLASVSAPMRFRAQQGNPADPFHGLYNWYLPPAWYSGLSAAGVYVTPDLALTLSAFYAGVTMIARDLATLPCQTFKRREDEGKDRVPPFYGEGIDTSGGIRSLAYMLRWQPNYTQTAVEYHVGMLAQYLMRGVAYAEIVSGSTGFMEQLLPRHPDRVQPERLSSGRLRYKLTEADGKPRYLTADEMHVVRELSLDGGLSTISRVSAGAQAIGSALATQKAAGRFFKSGMTAALVATYTGEKEEADETALHASISRFAGGVENSFGLMLIPDDVKITNLGIDPEKAQMIQSQEWGVREVARLLGMPGSKLGIKDSVSYNSQIQDSVNYVIGCLRPIAVTFEQAIQRDLILRKDTFFTEYLLEALLRGDPDARAAYFERAIRNRWMRPSEVRLRENLNPDPELDRLSAGDFRPGVSTSATGSSAHEPQLGQRGAGIGRAQFKALLAVHDNAARCVRRERHRVTQLATKHSDDVTGWTRSLREFYADHAAFIAQTMRISIDVARAYAAQHGSEVEATGVPIFQGEAGEQWERYEVDELALLALNSGERSVDAWFNRRLSVVGA